MFYLVFIILFAILLFFSLRVTRSALSPSVLFTAVWSISLMGLLLSGGTFYRISQLTLLIYFVGAIAFSLGGALGQAARQVSSYPASAKASAIDDSSQHMRRVVMDLILLVLIVGLPVYWFQAVEQFGGASDLTLALIRSQDVEQSGTTGSFNLVRNFPLLSALTAYALYYENDGTASRWWRAYMAAGLAIVYGSILGTKMTAVTVLVTIFFIVSLRGGKMRVGIALAVAAFAIVAFSVGLVLINFAYQDVRSPVELLHSILEGIQSYWLGGLVAFERIVQDPHAIESTQSIGRFFVETANSLGAQFYVPSLHAEYTDISGTLNTNVYTIYFTYYKDFGLGVTALLMCGVGFLCGYVYEWARNGRPIPVLFYAILAVAILLSIHAEHFLIGLNGYVKTALFFFVLYKVVPFFGSLAMARSKDSTLGLGPDKCCE
jgi:oligosaccharide repeat unit polymerase